MNKISTYFPVASKELHAVLEMVSNVKEKELEKKSAAINIVAEKERSDKIPEKYATSNAMRKRKRSEELGNLAPEIIAINKITLDLVRTEREAPKIKRQVLVRPNNWEILGEHYIQWGRVGTLRAFPEEFVDHSEASTEQDLRKWSLDVANNVQFNQNSNNRCPAYGHQIDLMLACQIKIRIDQGLPCDDISLRMLLMSLLAEYGMDNLRNLCRIHLYSFKLT